MKDYILPRGGFEREVFRKYDIKSPKPMTTDILREWLGTAIEWDPYCGLRPVMLGDKPLKRAYLRDRSIVLDHEGDTNKPLQKPASLIRYLEMCTAGIFHETKDKPVKIGEDDIVNANLDREGRVILMTFEDYLAERGNNE